MSVPVSVSGPDIETLLREHAMIWGDIGMHGYECVCGITDDDRRWTEADYYAHVAGVLRAHIVTAQADAWDEGWNRCADLVQDGGTFEDYYANPYRAALVGQIGADHD